MFHWPIPQPPSHMSDAEKATYDKIWAEHDKRMLGIYQEKLEALGLDASLVDAKQVYENQEKRNKIDKMYHSLTVENRMNDMISSIENIQRGLRNRES